MRFSMPCMLIPLVFVRRDERRCPSMFAGQCGSDDAELVQRRRRSNGLDVVDIWS